MQGGGTFAKEDVEKLYRDSGVASSYDQERFQSYRGRLKTMLDIDAVCVLIAREKHDRILDIATGTGRFVLEMAERFPGAEIVGIDQSAAMLNEARAKSSKPPRFLRSHLILKALARGLGADMVSFNIEKNRRSPRRISLSLIRRLQGINLSVRKYPPMKVETREALEEYCRRENHGLENIIQADVAQYWQHMKLA